MSAWAWPSVPLLFLSDLHADAEAFARSLALAELERVPAAKVVVGGDLLDKGPDELALLRALGELRRERELILLLGNHDLRFELALRHMGARDPRRSHFVVRLGLKGLRFLRRLYRQAGAPPPARGEAEARARLDLPAGWAEGFRAEIGAALPPAGLEREITRAHAKAAALADALQGDFAWAELDAALELARARFLDPAGEFAWVLAAGRLCWRAGDFLFVHAGVCDAFAQRLASEGPAGLERERRQQAERDPAALYYGPLGNALRTKYRAELDPPLTAAGAAALSRMGVRALVTGHRPDPAGPRLARYGGVLHLEGDCCLDAASRAARGLPADGAGALWLWPRGEAEGLTPGRRISLRPEESAAGSV
ncbi:MAG TPA: hypothetical protein DEA08_16155 [Planctomycetes bacterium]|nr:hypothetical protein [Planctomycetota bacterium]